jgi:excisionase family DNA binding protein
MVDISGQAAALLTTKETAKLLGISDAGVRRLIQQRKLEHLRIGARSMIRRDRLQNFIDDNTVRQCPEETLAPGSGSSKNADASISSGQTAVAAASAARALLTASKLSMRSQNSSKPTSDMPDRVIRLKSS